MWWHPVIVSNAALTWCVLLKSFSLSASNLIFHVSLFNHCMSINLCDQNRNSDPPALCFCFYLVYQYYWKYQPSTSCRNLSYKHEKWKRKNFSKIVLCLWLILVSFLQLKITSKYFFFTEKKSSYILKHNYEVAAVVIQITLLYFNSRFYPI